MIFDSHAHLTDPQFKKDRPQVIENALTQGVGQILTVCSFFTERETEDFATLLEHYQFIFGSAGIHPHDAKQWDKLWPELEKTLKMKKIVAFGEIGLDYHYDNSPRKVQKEVFRQQLKLANTQGLPVIIHSREAMEETLDILRSEGVGSGVMHCFSGSEEEMKVCLDLGLHISVAGPVTFTKASRLQRIVQTVPLDRLLVETDCPYLAPQPVRGKRNEPAFVRYVVEKIGQLREMTLEQVAKITTQNARRLFELL
jgi:TatD DNase family protein